jgi:predicted permease
VVIHGKPPKAGLMQFGKTVTPGFFATAGAHLVMGRDFAERDTEPGAPPVTVVNQTIVRFYFPGEDPLGRRINGMEIVGVVKDIIEGTMRAPRGVTYVPYHQDAGIANLCLLIRAYGDPSALKNRVRQELREIDSTLPVLNMETVGESLQDLLWRDRLLAALAGFFGVVAAILACLGLYGLISYATARRTNEIGIRLALGATRGRILGMVLRDTFGLALLGTVLGIPAALVMVRLVAANLFGTRSTDPMTIAGATFLLMAVAACAGFLPARRAAAVDPITALHHQ